MPDIHPLIASADWLKRKDLQALIAALDPEGGQCRYVGGVVRDTLRGATVNDIDMATKLLPQTVMERLKAHDIRAVPTGLDHGTVTAVLDSGHVEITTLRRDVSTDGRRATVAFSDDWKEDAARRDFTINALYLDPHTLEVHDYFGGQNDLANGIVRFIGSAQQRICEDYLRILRYFRFYARFGSGAPDAEALKACAAHKAGLKSLSRERVANEILALLQLPDPLQSADLMFNAGIWQVIIPEIDHGNLGQLKKVIAREQLLNLPAKSLTRFLSLLPKDAKIADKVSAKLRFSNAMRKDIQKIIQHLNIGHNSARAAAYKIGHDLATQAILLGADGDAFMPALEQIEDWIAPEFIISGKDIIAAGVTAGPSVSKALQEIEEAWIAQGFPDADVQKKICNTVSKSYID